MRSCPQCGRQASGAEQFCAGCGSFLRWQDPATSAGPAVAAGSGPPPAGGWEGSPTATAPPVPSETRVGVALSLSSDVLAVEPGESGRLEVTVRNQGAIVDKYALWVDGVPGPWAQAEPREVPVYPGQEATAAVVFRVPQDAGVPAGPARFRVIAQSVQNAGVYAVREGVVDVGAVTGIDVDVRPERRETDRTASFDVVLTNRGNHDVVVDLEVRDPQYQLQTQVDPERVHLPASGVATAAVHVLAPGEAPETPRPFPFTVQAVVAGASVADEVRAGADAVVVHRFRPPQAYVATMLGWLIAGALAGVLLAGVVAGLQWGLGQPVFALGAALPIGVAIVVVTVASALGARRAVRWRRGKRAGRTAGLLLLLTPLWAVGLVLAGRGAFGRGDLGSLLAVVVPFAVVNPALVARALALLGTEERGLPRPRRPRPQPLPARSGAPPGPGSQPPVRTPGPSRAAARPAGDVSSRWRSPAVLAGAAAVVVLLGAAGAVVGYRVAPVPGEVVQAVNVRLGPAREFPLVSQPLVEGTRVSVSCSVNGFGRLSSPVEGGFVFLEAVDTAWTPRPCD